jgi:peptidoglycan hydrolase-like protein with peptidoglycan-binding domain
MIGPPGRRQGHGCLATSGGPAGTSGATPRSPARRRGWLATSGGLAGAAAAGAVAMVAVTGGTQAPAIPAAPPVTTARVTRTSLVTTVLTEGTLGYASSRPVVNLLTGTYTRIPGPGRHIAAGGVLYAVDNLPVVLMAGRIPAWRAMAPGIGTGPDVTELERNLIALGYASGLLSSPGDVWTPATTAAVERWQQAAGLPVTGQIDLGRVVFLPGPVRTGAAAVAAGDPASPGQAPYQVTTDHRVVTVPLNPVSAPRVTRGEQVTVILPAGVSARARVTAIGPPAPSGSGTAGTPGPAAAGSAPAATTVLTIAPAHPRRTGTASGVPVQVSLTTHVASGVLAVPVSALLALSGGGYGLEVVEPSGAHRLVGVRTGVFAGSLVQVSGPRITAGTTVVVAQ